MVESKVANTNWYEMIIAFEDFIADPGFTWTNVRMLKIEYFTGEGGKQPNDLFLDDLRRVSVSLTNGADNLKWKRDGCNQLYALEDFEDADPDNPDYASIFAHFRNLHMINWFHVKKFEDGFTKDLKIPEDGTNGVAYGSYSDRIRDPYFLTNIVIDSTGTGVADEWIIQHFGGLPGFDPAADPDGDEMNNHDEYFAGTDPNDRDSALHLAPSEVAGSGTSGYVIAWPSEAYRTYAVEMATNLIAGTWMLVGRVQATPPENRFTHYPDGLGPHFYRVKLAP